MSSSGRKSNSSSRTSVSQAQHTELKEPEQGDRTLQALISCLATQEYPIGWYQRNSDNLVCLRIAHNEKYSLINTIRDGEFAIVDSNCISLDVPSKLSPSSLETFIQCIPQLLVSDFQVMASIIVQRQKRVYCFCSEPENVDVDMEVVGYRFHAYSTDFVDVRTKGSQQWRKIRTSQLKSTQRPANADRSAEKLIGLQSTLTRSEYQNGVLQTRVNEVESLLDEEQSKLRRERQRHKQALERKQTALAACQSELDEMTLLKQDAEKNVRRQTKNIAQLSEQTSRLKRSLSIAESKVEKLQQANDLNESQKRDMREQMDVQAAELERKTRTIEDLKKETGGQKQEIQKLRGDLTQLYRQNREHEDNEIVSQQRAKELRKVREENQRLKEQIEEMEKKNGEILGLSLISPYRSFDFGSEMAELRDQKLEDAVVVCSDSGMSLEDASNLLWRIFMFAYGFFEEKLARMLQMLNVSKADDVRARMFIIKMQDTYQETCDLSGLETAFLAEFGDELQGNEDNPEMLEYVRKCGEVCWCVVIHLDPKLHFLPRTNMIDPETPMMFDSSKFKDISGTSFRKGDAAQIVAFVLPGLYRVDANAPVSADALPCVYTKKVAKSMLLEEKPLAFRPKKRPQVVQSVPSRVTREQLLHEAEEDLWDGNVDSGKQKLAQAEIPLERIRMVCAEDGCGAVLFERWEDFEAHDTVFECPNNEDHQNLRIEDRWAN